MIEIKDLLSRFDTLLFSEERRVELIRNIISETIGLDIKKEDFKIRNNTIYLNIKPIYKNEILIKKEEIYTKLKENMVIKNKKINPNIR